MTGSDTALSYKLVLPSTNTPDSAASETIDKSVLPIKGIIFDMDGTLTKPQTWMFGQMRSQLSVPDGVDILSHLKSLPTDEEKHIAELKLRKIEEKAMVEQEPTNGLLNTFKKLNNFDIKLSICTRNVPKPVNDFCKKFLNCEHDVFGIDHNDTTNLIHGPIITREFKPPKPSPKPLLHICESWNVNPKQVIMVGDSIDDMDAGLNAGCAVILLRHDDNSDVEYHYLINGNESKLDCKVSDLNELFDILEHGLIVKPRA